MKKPFHTLLIVLLLIIAMMSGCGSGGGSDKNDSASSSFIYGVASKGPIIEGFVVAYELSSGGKLGKVLGNTFTGDNGSYIVDIGGYTGNILVEVKKGYYTDEATNAVKDNVILSAAVTRINGSAVVMVTPYTDIAVQTALDNGGLTESRIDKANALTGTIAGGVDIINTRPANVMLENDVAAANTDEITYGLALASISEIVHSNNAASVQAAISNISNDLADGKLDTEGAKLASALQAFLNNGNNRSGVSDISQTNLDEAIVLASNDLFDDDSSDINLVFRYLQNLYAAQSPLDTDIRGWFDNNIADGYLHDGRIKAVEADVWTGPGGLYQGVSLSVVLLNSMDLTGTDFKKGYLIRVSFSGSKGTGSILSSMVYDGTKWLWYGNRQWGVSLSNFLPRAEMTVDENGVDVSYTNGFDMVVWDNNLSAYNHGIRSAIVKGPGLGDGVILEHYYRTYQADSYFSIYPRGSGYSYPLTDDVVNAIPEDSEYTYTINFYAESADQLSLSSPTQAVRTETKTFTRKPYLILELNPSIFPALSSSSHDLSSLNIGGQVNVSWTNPADTSVNLASLNWIDPNGDAQSAVEYPESSTVTFDTSKPADLTAQLYLRGEDNYGRGVSLVWQYWKQSGLQEDVTAINDIFHELEQMFATPKSSDELNVSLTDWFNSNAAEDYLHNGKDSAKELEEWMLLGNQYEGLSVTAILLEPSPDDNWGPYQTGYRVMLYLSVPGGSGSILTSVVYDSTQNKWLWYGNRDWGLGLSGFLPWAEKTISSSSTDPTFDTGFEVIIWDSYLAACNKGKVKSAIITGPGLPDGGLKLKHHYDKDTDLCNPDKAYLTAVDSSGNDVSNYSLLNDAKMDDDQIREIRDKSDYKIDFYDVDVTVEGIIPQNYIPVKSLTRTIARGPVPIEDLIANDVTYFPEIKFPDSHDLSAANIGGTLDVHWINPPQMIVSFVSMGWLDLSDATNGFKYESDYPKYETGYENGNVTLTTTASSDSIIWSPYLYLRGEDSYNRRFSVTWHFSDTTSSSTPPAAQ